eukprot:XP_001707354.1 Hypothetical protein GL50803_19854 [Giardia lamblia ATCC 50803]
MGVREPCDSPCKRVSAAPLLPPARRLDQRDDGRSPAGLHRRVQHTHVELVELGLEQCLDTLWLPRTNRVLERIPSSCIPHSLLVVQQKRNNRKMALEGCDHQRGGTCRRGPPDVLQMGARSIAVTTLRSLHEIREGLPIAPI